MFGSSFILHASSQERNLYQKRVLVIAPHEDDEILACAGVIKRAVDNGDDIRVLYVTNGDIGNLQKTRIQESIAALSLLGVGKDKIIYLGYGDSTIMNLYNSKSTPEVTIPSKNNIQTTSFPEIGLMSYHTAKYGNEAYYTRHNITDDFYQALLEFQPDEIYMPAQSENHPDHSASAFFTIETILRMKQTISYQPTIFEYMIYAYNTPMGLWMPWLYCDPTKPVTNEAFDIDNYMPYPWYGRVSLPVNASMTASFTSAWPDPLPIMPSDNPKYNAIHQFVSQGNSWLYERFIRADEVFWKRRMSSLSYNATITASSENTASNQICRNVVDGVCIGELKAPFDGRNADFQNFEWATNGQTTGAWIQLNWQQPVTANQITLYDRPNFNDNILSGRLQFSDGSTVIVGKLNSNGSPTVVNFPPKTFSWVKFTVDSAEGINVGLSEFEVTNTTENIALKASVIASSQTANSQLAVKAIDGMVDGYPNNTSREWATAGQKTGAWIELDWPQEYMITKVVLHDRINTTDHVTSGKFTFSDGSYQNVGSLPNDGAGLAVVLSKYTKSLRFEITGFTGSNAGLAEIEVYGYPLKLNDDYTNIAPQARISISSETPGNNSGIKAVDGVRSGSPCDNGYEWVTNGQLNGAWIQLNWERTYHIKRVMLYDRPNPDDHILSGKLYFDDNSVLYVGSLPNDGTGLLVEIPQGKNIKWLRFEVTSAVGRNTGLSEIEVLGCPGSKIDVMKLNPVITSTPAKSGGIGNCFDEREETNYVSQDPGSLAVKQEPCYIQIALPNPISIARIRTLIGNSGNNSLKYDWWLEAADSVADLNGKTGTYIKVGDTKYDISGYWDTISLGAPLTKKVWRFGVKKKVMDDYSTVTELEFWSE